MGADAAAGSSAAREVFETADAVLGLPLSKLCFEGPEEELRRTEIQQPAILATSVALLRAIEEAQPLEPVCVLGHSLGEYTALVAAGAVSLEDALRLVHLRGRLMQEAVPEGEGAMAAILGIGPEEVEGVCTDAAESTSGVVSPANYNAPQQTVIAGHAKAVEAASALAKERGARRAVPLPVSAPFHCDLMAPAAARLAPELGRTAFSAPRAPVVHNVDGRAASDAARIPGLLEQQVTAPVRFTECVGALVEQGVTQVLEIGPGRVLTGLVARTERSLSRANVVNLEDVQQLAADGRSADD